MLLATGDGCRHRRLGFANFKGLGLADMYVQQSGIDRYYGMSARQLWSLPSALEHLKTFVADRSGQAGKSAVLNVTCPTVLVSQKTIDIVVPTLVQILRNAIEHGVESPVARLVAGKPMTAAIDLRVSVSGDRLLASVEDDGAGLEPAKAKRVRRDLTGISGENAVAAVGETRRAELFSRGIVVTSRYERGVSGLQRAMARMAGADGDIQFETTPGQGTTFHLGVNASVVMAEGSGGIDAAALVSLAVRAPH